MRKRERFNKDCWERRYISLSLDNYLYLIFFVREKGEKMVRKIIFLVSLLVLVFGGAAEESVFDFFKPGVIFDFEKVMKGAEGVGIQEPSLLQENSLIKTAPDYLPQEENKVLVSQENIVIITSEGNLEDDLESNSEGDKEDSGEQGVDELLIEESEIVQITITKKGFDPAEVRIESGQSVMWVNERERLDALVVIVKGMPNEVSELLGPFEYFTWEFSEPGEYVYVDGVVIGQMGKVVVG